MGGIRLNRLQLRLCAAALAVLLLVPLFAACGKKPAVTADPAASDTTAPEAGYTLPTFDFEGHEFNILSVGRKNVVENDFLFDDKNPSVLDAAVERRNRAVEGFYNIKIVTEQKNSTANQQSPEAYRALVREATAGDYTYDACVIPGYDVSQLAYEGYLTDLGILPYFNAENEWYDQGANETFRFAGSLFFTTGDFGINMMDQAYCVAFNKDLAAQYHVENLYDLVDDNLWTLEKMYSIAKDVSDDTDGDSVTDVYGLLYWVDAVYGVVNAAGQRMVTLNDTTDTYELTLNTETTYNVLELFYNMTHDSRTSLMYQHNSAAKEYVATFSGNQALFFMTTIGTLSDFRDMETDYGILPYAHYSERQTVYESTVAPYYMNFLCVPLLVEDEARTSAILEAIGSYSHEYIIPAYYEKTLMGQYTRDEESAEMLDIIFGGRAYDLGYCYQPANLNKNLIYLLQSGSFDWSSRYASLEQPASIILGVISEAYRRSLGITEEQ